MVYCLCCFIAQKLISYFELSLIRAVDEAGLVRSHVKIVHYRVSRAL